MNNNQDFKKEKIEVSERLAFDDKKDQYIWFRFGWQEKNIYNIFSSIIN